MSLRHVVVVLICSVAAAHAQPAPAPEQAPAPSDRVELVTRTNGVVRGKVIDRSATAYTIVTDDGTQVAVPYSDVLEVHALAAPPPPAPAPEPAPVDKAAPIVAPQPAPVDKAPVMVRQQAPRPHHGKTRLSFASGIGSLNASYSGTGMFSTPPAHYDGSGSLTFVTAAIDVGFNAGPTTIGVGFTTGRDISDGECLTFGANGNLLVSAGPVVFFGVDGGVFVVNEHCDFNGNLTGGEGSSGGAQPGGVDLGVDGTILAVRVGGRGGLRFPVGPKAYLSVELRGGVNVANIDTGKVDIYPTNGASDHATVENLILFDGALMFAGGFNL